MCWHHLLLVPWRTQSGLELFQRVFLQDHLSDLGLQAKNFGLAQHFSFTLNIKTDCFDQETNGLYMAACQHMRSALWCFRFGNVTSDSQVWEHTLYLSNNNKMKVIVCNLIFYIGNVEFFSLMTLGVLMRVQHSLCWWCEEHWFKLNASCHRPSYFSLILHLVKFKQGCCVNCRFLVVALLFW